MVKKVASRSVKAK